MATIGSFKKVGNDFQGEIITLSLQAKGVRIVAETNPSNDKAPSHRVFVGRAEIGAAWSKRSNEGRDYLSVKLDDPSFNSPIYATSSTTKTATASPSSGRAVAGRTETEPIPPQCPARTSGRGIRIHAVTASWAAAKTSRADLVAGTCSAPSTRGPSIPRSRPQTFLRQVRCGPSGCRIARTLPPIPHAGLQRLSRRDSGLHPIAPRLHPG